MDHESNSHEPKQLQARRAARLARREERVRQATSASTREPTVAGHSTIHPANSLPSAPISPETPTSSLPAQQRRRWAFITSQRDPRKMDTQGLEEALCEQARLTGFQSDFSSFKSKLIYQELLEAHGILSPPDFHEAAGRGGRRRSVAYEPSREFLECALKMV